MNVPNSTHVQQFVGQTDRIVWFHHLCNVSSILLYDRFSTTGWV